MGLHIVAGYNIVSEFKKSKYFRQNLGLVATVEKNGRRVFNNKDNFAFFYNNLYRTTIYAQGNIGDIKFYMDHFIKDTTIAVYYGESSFEEFLFKFEFPVVREKGLDFYIGHLIKTVEEKYEDKVKNDEIIKSQPVPEGNADMLTKNPGAVSYADVKAYLAKKQQERYKNNNSLL